VNFTLPPTRGPLALPQIAPIAAILAVFCNPIGCSLRSQLKIAEFMTSAVLDGGCVDLG
jgi:hypothetical protein